jgi:hypothetical protein
MGKNSSIRPSVVSAPSPGPNRLAQCGSGLRCLNRVALLLLFISVPVLLTLAKESLYLPQMDAGHYLNKAIKTTVAHHPIVLEREPLTVINKIIPPRCQFISRPTRPPNPDLPSINLAISLQHRSPPSSLT